MTARRDDVLRALEKVIDPELRRSVVELDMVRDLNLEDGIVSLTIALTVPGFMLTSHSEGRCPLRRPAARWPRARR